MLGRMSRQSTINNWHPASWQAKKAKQQPNYPDQAALSDVVAQLSALPPLVTSGEVDLLKEQIAQAQRGFPSLSAAFFLGCAL